jgi:flagellar biosynthetic protein FliQ
MTPEAVITIGQQAVEMTLMITAPLLLTALVIGLVVSIFQAATQINEMTLSFIPKILGVFGALVLMGPWLLQLITDFTRDLLQNIPLMLS